jgi:Zn-dependent membrane protease YugP
MLIISLIIMAISWLAQSRLKSKFELYSQTPLQANLSGQEVAELMLADAGIRDVKVYSVEGKLTDHYNPTDKTVNLSPDVFYGRNAAAAAVAAHEVGHAVQHATAYSMLMFRSSMVPMLSAVSTFMPWLIIGGVFALQFTIIPLGIGVALFALTTLFSFITLPVEFDASRRGLAFVQRRGVVNAAEYDMAKDALWWAASTYVIAAIGSLVTLLYYVMILLGRRND